jgi:hypothetical protein
MEFFFRFHDCPTRGIVQLAVTNWGVKEQSEERNWTNKKIQAVREGWKESHECHNTNCNQKLLGWSNLRST